MRDIVLEASKNDAIVFNIADLQEHLEQLADKRGKQGRIYPLSWVLALIVMAKLAGEDNPTGITGWIRERAAQLWRLFDWRHERMPCVNTIRTILSEVVDASELEAALVDYLHQRYGGLQSELVAVDGKTLRGTIPKGMTRGVHLLAVYLPEEGVVLKQVMVDRQENEISVAQEALADVDLKGRVVCADAMQTQRELSAYIVGQGGDYLWFVKDNQPTLRADIEQFFKPPRRAAGWHIPALPSESTTVTTAGHGRTETRTLTVMRDDQQFLGWPAVTQVFKLERTVTYKKSGKTTREVAYGLTSCSVQRASPTQLLRWTRTYWGIENGLHYRRDVTLHEDATRMSNDTMASVIATLNNFVIGLTQKLGYNNLPAARRHFGFRLSQQLLG